MTRPGPPQLDQRPGTKVVCSGWRQTRFELEDTNILGTKLRQVDSDGVLSVSFATIRQTSLAVLDVGPRNYTHRCNYGGKKWLIYV